MNKTNLKAEIIFWVILLAPFIYLAVAWNQLPARVPMRFNWAGEPTRWSSRNMELLVPVVNLATYLLLLFLPLIDPKKMNYTSFASVFFKMRLLLSTFLAAMSLLVINSGLTGHIMGNGRWLGGAILLFLALMGNFIISIKPNWFIGIRNPWTLSSDTVWRKTHLIGGRIFFYGGLLCLLLVFMLPAQWLRALILTYVLGTVVFSTLYSFWLYKNEEKNLNPNS